MKEKEAKIVTKCDFCGCVAEVIFRVTGFDNGEGGGQSIRSCLPDIVFAIEVGKSTPTIDAKTRRFRCINLAADDKEWREMKSVY